MSDVRAADLTQQTVETVRRWLRAADDVSVDAPAARFGRVLADPAALDFTVGFVDGVLLPDDPGVAARHLDRLSRSMPESLPWHLRAAVSAGGGFGPLAPRAVIPVAKRAFRRLVEHLVVDETPDRLGAHLASLSSGAVRPNLAPLGAPVVGPAGADRRLARVHALVARDDVHHVSISLADVTAPFAPWALDEGGSALVARLTPLYELARAGDVPTLIDLDMGGHGELDLAVDVFTRLLDQPTLRGLTAGITLQAYLPDALSSLELLTDWARNRVETGGAPIRVRLVKGANLGAEAVDSSRHARGPVTLATRVATDASFKRLVDHALRPANAEVVHVGIASHNLFDLAHAWSIAERRAVTHLVTVETVHGLAPAQTAAVAAEVGGLALYTPVATPDEFDVVVGGVVRGLGGARSVGTAVELGRDAGLFEGERRAYLRSVELVDDPEGAAGALDGPEPARPASTGWPGFAGAPDADPAHEHARSWGRRVLSAARTSDLGLERIDAARVAGHGRLEEVVARAVEAGVAWGRRPHSQRAELLDAVATALDDHRSELVEVMISETGTTLTDADHDVSAAVDAARWHATLARGLDDIVGARYAPPRLTVVVPPADSAVSTSVAAVTAALAAGSGVLLRPAAETHRTAAVLADVLWSAGAPRPLVAVAIVDDADLDRELLTHPAVDRVVLHGSFGTAARVKSSRGDRELWAETPGANSVVVTESADLDRAAADVVAGAFAHSGQAPWSARTVILVGSVGRSEHLRRQLVDAAASLRVGWPDVATTALGPLVDPAEGPLLDALTTLSDGETWWVEPERIDDEGLLWRPGVRDGVRPGGPYRSEAAAGPVLGIVHVETLDEAIDVQNGLESSSTAALHSLDDDEVARWVDRVDVGSLVVNRAVVGPRAGRRPAGGGRRRSTIGRTAASGGANTVVAQGAWSRIARTPEKDLKLDGVSDRVVRVIEAARSHLSFDEFDRIRAAARSDESAWRTTFGSSREIGDLAVERVVLRHRPASVVLRVSSDGDQVDLVRLVVAAARAGSRLDISSARPVPAPLALLLRSPASPIEVGDLVVENDESFLARLATGRLQGAAPVADAVVDLGMAPKETPTAGVAHYRELRIRLVGGGRRDVSAATGHSADVSVWTGEVTDEGRVELLPFVHEQTVTIAAHRDGRPDAALRDLRI